MSPGTRQPAHRTAAQVTAFRPHWTVTPDHRPLSVCRPKEWA
jgi:hypothetical protein